MSAWIEMISSTALSRSISVALYMSAWIEILDTPNLHKSARWSHSI